MATRRTTAHPLRIWRLGGFRSIEAETSFELGGLNILIGANSAGKSSVLYSLLTVAQTLANPLSDRPLVLNGHLVRLGLADDIVHESKTSGVTIGFDLVPSVDYATPGVPKQDFDSLSVTARFAIAASNDLQVRETHISTSLADSSVSLVMSARDRTDARRAYVDARLQSDLIDDWVSTDLLGIAGAVPSASVGAQRRQFLPNQIWSVVNAFEGEIEVLQWAVPLFDVNPRRVADALPNWRLSEEAGIFLQEQLIAQGHNGVAEILGGGATDKPVNEWLAELSDQQRIELRTFLTTDYPRVADVLPFRGVGKSNDLPSPMAGSLDYARRWFAENLFHIGPLRAEPRPLYELPLAASEASVGRNGEFTAAVLSAHGGKLILAPSVDGGPPRRQRLGDAVNDWMAVMDLAASVQSEDRGKLGYEVHLALPGVSRELDLTTVGVGVSQALPIVVLGLIAEPGSLLLFEQPELHLHPDVQASLGDFFLALSRTGRQLIVETHSEYLVNRLRRRAAEDQKSDIPDSVRLFFFERNGASSSIGAARIGVGGKMRDWPRGFLDTAAREVEAIATANTRSRGA